jgi:hypothetical protein
MFLPKYLVILRFALGIVVEILFYFLIRLQWIATHWRVCKKKSLIAERILSVFWDILFV